MYNQNAKKYLDHESLGLGSDAVIEQVRQQVLTMLLDKADRGALDDLVRNDEKMEGLLLGLRWVASFAMRNTVSAHFMGVCNRPDCLEPHAFFMDTTLASYCLGLGHSYHDYRDHLLSLEALGSDG